MAGMVKIFPIYKSREYAGWFSKYIISVICYFLNFEPNPFNSLARDSHSNILMLFLHTNKRNYTHGLDYLLIEFDEIRYISLY